MATKPATLEDCIAIAVTAHEDQKDKSGDPYITHPLRVMGLVMNHMPREHPLFWTVAKAAVLHDVPEDTHISLIMLKRFGVEQAVVDTIESVTKRDGESYAEFIIRAKQHPAGRWVKYFDIYDNYDPVRLARLDPEESWRLRLKYTEPFVDLKMTLEREEGVHFAH